MDNVINFLQNDIVQRVIWSLVTILVGIIIYRVIKFFLAKQFRRAKLESNQKLSTINRLFLSVARYAIIILVFLRIFEVNGVDVGSLVAGIGILGAIIGLAAQDWLKDVIRGTSLISDQYFAVGDVVKYEEEYYIVTAIGLKTTKLQSLADKSIVSLANRNIEAAEVATGLIYVDVPMPYDISRKQAATIIDKIISTTLKDELIKKCRNLGTKKLADSSILYLLEAECDPAKRLGAKRAVIGAILDVYEKEGIEVPYEQLVIHQGKSDSKKG